MSSLSVHILLALALSRPDRMELALRQATELGAVGFVGFRGIPKPVRIERRQGKQEIGEVGTDR